MNLLSSLAKELRNVFDDVAERQGKNGLYQANEKADRKPVYQRAGFCLVGKLDGIIRGEV